MTATEARAERVERDAAGEDDGVEDEVEGLDVVGVVAVNDERLDREDHCPDDEVEAEAFFTTFPWTGTVRPSTRS